MSWWAGAGVGAGVGLRVGVNVGVCVGCSSCGALASVCCGFLSFHLLME
jgi:hypothetical protein